MICLTATHSTCRFEWLQLLYLHGDVTINYFFSSTKEGSCCTHHLLVVIEWHLTDGLIRYFRFTQVDICDFATAPLDAVLSKIEGANSAEKRAVSYHLEKCNSSLLYSFRPVRWWCILVCVLFAQCDTSYRCGPLASDTQLQHAIAFGRHTALGFVYKYPNNLNCDRVGFLGSCYRGHWLHSRHLKVFEQALCGPFTITIQQEIKCELVVHPSISSRLLT